MYVRMYVRKYLCMYLCMLIYIYTHMYIHDKYCVYLRIHVYIHIEARVGVVCTPGRFTSTSAPESEKGLGIRVLVTRIAEASVTMPLGGTAKQPLDDIGL